MIVRISDTLRIVSYPPPATTDRMSAHLLPRAFLPILLLFSIATPILAAGCAPPPASLQKFLRQGGWGAPNGYTAALYDLNGDGIQEAVILLTGPDWCGSGGCTLLVANQHERTWRLISKTTLVHIPVLVLERKHSGWHSLGVTVGGGGVAAQPVILDFRHGRYPANPTMPPAPVGSPSSTGKPLISRLRCQAL